MKIKYLNAINDGKHFGHSGEKISARFLDGIPANCPALAEGAFWSDENHSDGYYEGFLITGGYWHCFFKGE